MSAYQSDQSSHVAQPMDAASTGVIPGNASPAAPDSQAPTPSRARHTAGSATIDLNQIAQLLLRTDIDTDVRAFAVPDSGTPIHLVCLKWPDEVGLAGHSDGDVVAHACYDALFSTAGLGNLGSNFGAAEPQWKGASGTAFLNEAAHRVREAGFEIGNITVQLVGECPRVTARSAEASRTLSKAASVRVSFSTTTTDHLGFLGHTEGLLAVATVLIYPVPGTVHPVVG